MISRKNRLNFILLIVFLVFIAFCFVFVFIRTERFNKKDRVKKLSELTGKSDKNAELNVVIKERNDSSARWEFVLSDEMAEKAGADVLKANTFDVRIENKSPYEIINWNISFEAEKPCFLGSAWCGKVDIIQQRDGKVLAQNFDLRKLNRKRITIEKFESGDICLFPLNKGDVFVYYPNYEEKECPLIGTSAGNPDSHTAIGFIIYGKNTLASEDFFNAAITYKFRKRIIQDPAFKILTVITVVWFFFLLNLLLSEDRINEVELLELKDKKYIREIMETLSGFVDAKDPYTGGHSIRVGKYGRQLAEEMGLDKDKCEQVFYCGLLHDCGKISIHDDILAKPKNLSDEEFALIKSHTVRGFEILSDLTTIPEACLVARYHHERYDGKGYPDGISGKSIPLYARIICIADAFDAMNSNRCYRNHMGPDMIIKQINENSGRQFDPDVADAMLRLIMRGEINFFD